MFPVSEQFGPTVQGEGPYAGRRVQFLRLGGCNLTCSWCDTAYTWDGSRFDLRAELTNTSVDSIVDEALPGVPLVLSGGEPLLHQTNPQWSILLSRLAARCGEVHVETNGTIEPSRDTMLWVSFAAISPKLPFAGTHRGKNAVLHPGWVRLARNGGHRLGASAVLKFVVRGADDVDQAVALASEWGWPADRVWVMPEGTTVETLGERWPIVAARAAEVGVSASHRLHVLAFGDVKGW